MLTTNFDLLVAWRAGDRRAGRELFDRHFETLYRFFDSKLAEDPEALVRDTFVQCCESPEWPVHTPGSRLGAVGLTFRLLLLRVARAKLYAFLERGEPTSMTIEELGGVPATLVEDVPASFHRALTLIPLESQLIVELLLTEDLTPADLAHVLDATLDDTLARIHRAITLLHEKLAVLGGLEEAAELEGELASILRDARALAMQ